MSGINPVPQNDPSEPGFAHGPVDPSGDDAPDIDPQTGLPEDTPEEEQP